jgi:hypothetical protein
LPAHPAPLPNPKTGKPPAKLSRFGKKDARTDAKSPDSDRN